MRIGLLIALLAVTACSNSREEQLVRWQAKCETYGFQPGTTEMAECIERREDAYWEAVGEAFDND